MYGRFTSSCIVAQADGDDGVVDNGHTGGEAQQEERKAFAPRRTYYGCRGASSLSHTARQVSSLSSATAIANILLATRARSALQTDLRGASRASRRSSASARILAFLSRASSTDNHSFTARISSLAYRMRIPTKAVIILPDNCEAIRYFGGNGVYGYRPTTRLLSMLELLQARGRMGGPELARRLEVGERTVRRYVAMLQEMGVPVEAERGRYGAYALRPGFKLPPMMFTDEEALALALGLLSARRLGLSGAAPAVEGAQAKLERAMPEGLRDRVRTFQEVVAPAAAAPARLPAGEIVVTLSAAVRERMRVWMKYRSGDVGRLRGPWTPTPSCRGMPSGTPSVTATCGKDDACSGWIGCSRWRGSMRRSNSRRDSIRPRGCWGRLRRCRRTAGPLRCCWRRRRKKHARSSRRWASRSKRRPRASLCAPRPPTSGGWLGCWQEPHSPSWCARRPNFARRCDVSLLRSRLSRSVPNPGRSAESRRRRHSSLCPQVVLLLATNPSCTLLGPALATRGRLWTAVS